jgi:hypothetical protein
MKPSNFPDLPPDVRLEIEGKQKKIHDWYWRQLDELDESYDLDSILGGPPPVMQPMKLMKILTFYACDLFKAQASRYPESDRLKVWLDNLGRSILSIIMDRISHIRHLQYHASKRHMRLVVTHAIELVKNQRLNRRMPPPESMQGELNIPAKPQRLSARISSPVAVRKLDAYLAAKGIGLTEFAGKAGTTDRTLRTFRKTGKVRRDIFKAIAEAMGMTKEELLSD